MFSALITYYKVGFSLSVNHTLYYFKKIPWLGKQISEDIYEYSKIKFILGALVEIVKLLLGFLLSVLAMGFVLLPIYILEDQISNIELFYHNFFFFYFFISPILSNIIFTTVDVKSYTLIRILRINKRDLFMAKIFFTQLITILRYLVILMIVGLFMDFSTIELMALTFYVILMKIIWEGISLFLFTKLKISIFHKPLIFWGLPLVILVVTYPLPFLGVMINIRTILLSIPFFLMIVLTAIISVAMLYNYKSYHLITRDTLSRSNIFDLEQTLQNATFADVNLEEEKLCVDNTDKYDGLEGYTFFNKLFFDRHKSIIYKPIKLRVIILSLITIVVWGFLIIKPELQQPAVKLLAYISPYMVFVMYLVSTGEKFVRTLFFNCDRYMLKEGYYKEKQAILANFTFRLKKIMSLNLLPALVMVIMILGIGVIGGLGKEIIQLLPLLVTIFALALFFAIHYLFLYYILQPFTVQLTNKSPLFSIINWVVYMGAYMSMQTRTASINFTIGVLAFTLTYVVIAIIATYTFAPKTFKLK